MADHHPVFARLYPAVGKAMERGGMDQRRQTLLAGLSGIVVEVGAGDGLNFPHDPPGLDRYLFPAARTPVSFHILGTATRGD